MKRAVVTGGTGGLGRAVVQTLLARGDRVAVPFRNEWAFQELRTASHESESLWGAAADLSDAASTQRFFDAAAERFGGLDALAALAGGWAGGATLESAPPSELEAMLRVNLVTVHGSCRAALPHLLAQPGSVVTVSSRLAEAGGPGSAAYAAAKAAVLSLTRSLAAENRARGVRFNCVVPTTIDTPANRQAMPKADPSKWTAPDAIARVIEFLLSPDSGAITGAVIPVDAP
jgi:NAD(P)-dependent dehydrogenase (short-subunit alcohol dehydrogenase family)